MNLVVKFTLYQTSYDTPPSTKSHAEEDCVYPLTSTLAAAMITGLPICESQQCKKRYKKYPIFKIEVSLNITETLGHLVGQV